MNNLLISREREYENSKRAKGMGHAIKHYLGKIRTAVSSVVSIEEDAILKSKDWPHLWTGR